MGTLFRLESLLSKISSVDVGPHDITYLLVTFSTNKIFVILKKKNINDARGIDFISRRVDSNFNQNYERQFFGRHRWTRRHGRNVGVGRTAIFVER